MLLSAYRLVRPGPAYERPMASMPASAPAESNPWRKQTTKITPASVHLALADRHRRDNASTLARNTPSTTSWTARLNVPNIKSAKHTGDHRYAHKLSGRIAAIQNRDGTYATSRFTPKVARNRHIVSAMVKRRTN